jgi:hypothetical protein
MGFEGVSCESNKSMVCHDPNFGLATKARACDQSKGLKRCGSKMQPMSHIHIPRTVGEFEGMNPHTRKWVPTLGIIVSMDF